MSIYNYISRKDNKPIELPKKENEEENNNVNGLIIKENVISKELHDQLWNQVNLEKWSTELYRRTQHYGYKYNYKSRTLKEEDIADPLPQWSIDLCNHLINEGLISTLPQQLIVNEYIEQQGISTHIDSKVFDNTIFSISLGSPCKMIFKKSIHPPTSTSTTNTLIQTQQHQQPKVLQVTKDLLARSFMLIKDEARYNWTHEIPKLKKGQHRISLTFRYVTLKPSSSSSTSTTTTTTTTSKK